MTMAMPTARATHAPHEAPTGLRHSVGIAIAKLSAIEVETLRAWTECDVGHGFGFKGVARRCGTAPHQIRRAVRSLARKGMVEYCHCLFWEDEDKIGAGYILTEAGHAQMGGLR